MCAYCDNDIKYPKCLFVMTDITPPLPYFLSPLRYSLTDIYGFLKALKLACA